MKTATMSVVIISILLFINASSSSSETDLTQIMTRDYALVVVEEDSENIQEVANFIERIGGDVLIIIPPKLMTCRIPDQILQEIIGSNNIEKVYTNEIPIAEYQHEDATVRATIKHFNSMVKRTHHIFGGIKQEPATEDEYLNNDAWKHPHIDENKLKDYLKQLGINAEIFTSSEKIWEQSGVQRYNSESMMGRIVVSVFFVESNGSIDPDLYTWNATDKDNTISDIQSALEWWGTRADLDYGNNMNYLLNIFHPGSSICQTGYEPILHPSWDAGLWVEEIMDNYYGTSGGGDHLTRVEAFNFFRRQAFDADWAYTAFICYNPQPAADRFLNGYAAWAYLGGPYTMLLFRSFSWSFDRVFAHETGHIFWACDEYYQLGYGGCTSCGPCNSLRPEYNNGNCEYCNPSSVPCMMKRNSWILCSFTPGHIGWFGPAPPELDYPLNGATLADNTTPFSWEEVIGATRYWIQIDDNIDFSSPIINNPDLYQTAFVPQSPLSNGLYYWKVCAGDRLDNWSDFSETRCFTIESKPAPFISSMSPRAGLSPTLVTITGLNFGIQDEYSKVLFSWGAAASIDSWEDESILCYVPALAKSGYVKIVTNQGSSNGLYFNVSDGNVYYADDSNLGTLIQNAQFGDIVIITPGVYYRCSMATTNHNVKIIGDDPNTVIIEPTLTCDDEALTFNLAVDTNTVLAGITFRNFNHTSHGGAIRCSGGDSPLIENCIFENNTSLRDGGAIYINGGSPIIRRNRFVSNYAERGGAIVCFSPPVYPQFVYNIFKDNSASSSGGCIQLYEGIAATIHQNTFVHNNAPEGSAVYSRGQIQISNNIFHSNYGGCAIGSRDYCLDVICSNFWMNTPCDRGKFVSPPECESPVGQDGNISADPQWCDEIDYCLNANSECVDIGGCGIMGARGVGCGVAPIILSVLSPNGGEILNVNTIHEISWDAECNTGIDSLQIAYSTNSGVSFSDIATVTDGSSYMWTIPEDPSRGCLVRIAAYTHPENYAIAYSDSVFEIRDPEPPTVTLLGPDCEEEHIPSSQIYQIKWHAEDNIGFNWNLLELYYSEGWGKKDTFVHRIPVDNDYLTDSTYNWVVPDSLATPYGKLKIVVYDKSYNTASDISDCYLWFYITEVDPTPTRNLLYPNYPNPFNPSTNIKYSIGRLSFVSLNIFDVKGALVKRLVNEYKDPGTYNVMWTGVNMNGVPVSSGVYFIMLKTEHFKQRRKMVLLK
jgi:hypothetical protein